MQKGPGGFGCRLVPKQSTSRWGTWRAGDRGSTMLLGLLPASLSMSRGRRVAVMRSLGNVRHNRTHSFAGKLKATERSGTGVVMLPKEWPPPKKKKGEIIQAPRALDSAFSFFSPKCHLQISKSFSLRSQRRGKAHNWAHTPVAWGAGRLTYRPSSEPLKVGGAGRTSEQKCQWSQYTERPV